MEQMVPAFSFLLSNTSSFVFEIFRSKKLSFNHEFRTSNWRKYSARLFSSWRRATKAMSSANFTRVWQGIGRYYFISVYRNQYRRENTPCGAPLSIHNQLIRSCSTEGDSLRPIAQELFNAANKSAVSTQIQKPFNKKMGLNCIKSRWEIHEHNTYRWSRLTKMACN